MSLRKFLKDSLTELQQKVANRLNARVNTYSIRQQRIGLVVFGLVTGTFCLFLIIGIVGTNDSQNSVRVDSISLPKSIHPVMDSMHTWPSKAMDSVKSIIRQLYKDRLQ